MKTPTTPVVERDANVRPFAVYVAASASSSQAARVTAVIATLRADGFVVTCTWPEIVAKVGSANPRDARDIDRRGWVVQDLAEVEAADALWFLVPTPPVTTCGGWCEATYAYAIHKHVVYSGDTKQSVFSALGIEFATDTAALAHLRALRDRARVDAVLADLRDCAPLKPEPPQFDLGGEG